MDDFPETHGDLLKEVPEAEDALRAYRERQMQAAGIRAMRKKQQAALDVTYASLFEQFRKAEGQVEA